jgi:hypothetical protein
MISDSTIERMKSLKKRVDEIVALFGVPEPVAWDMLAADSSSQAAETAARLERAQKRSLAAAAATFKANTEGEK